MSKQETNVHPLTGDQPEADPNVQAETAMTGAIAELERLDGNGRVVADLIDAREAVRAEYRQRRRNASEPATSRPRGKSREAEILDTLHPDLSRGSALGEDQLIDDLACVVEMIGTTAPKAGEIADDTIPNAAFLAYRMISVLRDGRKREGGGSDE